MPRTLPDISQFRSEWRGAAKRVGVKLPEDILPLLQVVGARERSSHVELSFKSERIKDWASTDLMSDGPFREEYIEEKYGLPRGSVKNVWVRFITLGTSPIPEKDFKARYPDVPMKSRYDFVLLHEIGHVVRGSREAAADEYAFRRMLLVENPEAKAMRAVWYAKMPAPDAILNK